MWGNFFFKTFLSIWLTTFIVYFTVILHCIITGMRCDLLHIIIWPIACLDLDYSVLKNLTRSDRTRLAIPPPRYQVWIAISCCEEKVKTTDFFRRDEVVEFFLGLNMVHCTQLWLINIWTAECVVCICVTECEWVISVRALLPCALDDTWIRVRLYVLLIQQVVEASNLSFVRLSAST